MKKGGYSPEPGQKPFELAALFVRLYRSLDAMTGGDDDASAKWLSNPNTALDGIPIEFVQSVSGLTNVISYLDARRAVAVDSKLFPLMEAQIVLAVSRCKEQQ